MILKGQCFETISNIERESETVLNSIVENDFHNDLEAWKKRWDCCVYSRRDYFEAEGSQIELSQH
jgi:hypothetical protein